MRDRRFLPAVIIAGLSAVCLGLCAAFCIRWESRHVCGVVLGPDREKTGELEFELLLDGLSAPYDAATDTYYVPQDPDRNGWSGKLSSAEGFELAFCENGMFSYRPSAIECCHVFTLFVSDGEVTDSVGVMFTGLPALCLERKGRLDLFCPDGSADRGARTVSSFCEFHARGYESELWPKSSYKLTLLDGAGGYSRAQLLGMRPDDDWLLLPMYNDRTKLREKLALELWAQIAALSPYALEGGAEGEYVEVFIDGSYEGVYLLCQRVDAKLSGGDRDDTVYLFDGPDVPSPEEMTLTDGFFCRDVEIRSTHGEFSPELWDGCRLWTETVFWGEGRISDLARRDNILDFYLYTTLVSAPRYGFQSFFLVCHQNYGEVTFVTVPTDMKFSFGCGFSETEAVNNTEYRPFAAEEPVSCPVYGALSRELGSSEAAALAAERYAGLGEVFCEENLVSLCEELSEELLRSGALARDGDRWPGSLMGAGEEELLEYIRARLRYMDGLFEKVG